MNSIDRAFETLFMDVYGNKKMILQIKPNSTTDSYIGDSTLPDPFYINIKDNEFNEEIFLSLTIEQAEKIRDLLDDKIKLIKENM